MNFTFGILTDGYNDDRVNEIIDSIEAEKIAAYEILIVGISKVQRANTRLLEFDDVTKMFPISKKKNLITDNAQYENIVYLHDYIKLLPGWYSGFGHYGSEFAICMNPIVNYDGSRFRDWTLWPGEIPYLNAKAGTTLDSHECLLPYDVLNLSKYMYVSGAYFVAKREVMQKYRFDEHLKWGQGEDVAWSASVRQTYKFSMNVHSAVQLMKAGKPAIFKLVPTDAISLLRKVEG